MKILPFHWNQALFVNPFAAALGMSRLEVNDLFVRDGQDGAGGAESEVAVRPIIMKQI